MAAPVEDFTVLKVLGRRQNGCVICQSGTPSCPACAEDEDCSISLPDTCTQCPQAVCVKRLSTPTPASSSSKGPSTGAIVGAVVGGVALIAIVGVATYLVWRFCIKTKRHPLDQEPWEEDMGTPATEGEKAFARRRTQRSSTHTVHSIASTVLTRASNIIQIAYIPGVTNRATPTSPTLLVPPVPPIPITVSQANTPSNPEDQHFFVPGDLRDSTYSGISAYTDRTSYAPRSSVASTIYGKSGIVLTPAQTGMRAKAAMVSVRSGVSGGSGVSTPPVPSIDFEKYNSLAPPSPAAAPVSPAGSAFSVGSTFLNSASTHTAVPAKAQAVQVVRVGGGPKKALAPETPRAEGPTSPLAQSSMTRDSNAATLIDDSPSPDQGPFSDPPEEAKASSPTTSLSAVIEEATRRASQRHSTVARGRSPFGDEHATHD